MLYQWIVGYSKSHVCYAILTQPMWIPEVTIGEYTKYFLATVALEFPVYFLLLRDVSRAKKLLVTVLVNVVTHPFVFLVLPKIIVNGQRSYSEYALIAETFAPFAEGLILTLWLRQGGLRGLAIAVAANLFSWTIGAMALS